MQDIYLRDKVIGTMDEETSENAELLALQRIDDTCVKLQEQGKYLEASRIHGTWLLLRQHFFGADSDEVWRACKTVGKCVTCSP